MPTLRGPRSNAKARDLDLGHAQIPMLGRSVVDLLVMRSIRILVDNFCFVTKNAQSAPFDLMIGPFCMKWGCGAQGGVPKAESQDQVSEKTS